jgi:ferrochelatase
MRYGKPSLASTVGMLRLAKVGRLIAFPMYPQYSWAATKSSLDETTRQASRLFIQLAYDWVRPFYNHPSYIQAQLTVAKRFLAGKEFDHYLFSFHGLPERQIRKADPSNGHCLESANCCEVEDSANRDCYRHQCFETAKAIASGLQLPPEKWGVSFQSRLGRTPWIRPFTDELYETLPKQGVKKLAVFCPSFVADCLETLEEVQIRGKKQFQEAGGEVLELVPSLNVEPTWVKGVAEMIREYATSPGT